jgi:hypothetical protein
MIVVVSFNNLVVEALDEILAIDTQARLVDLP